MCALVALSGSHGMFILHVCVDIITLPSGRLIEIGLDVGSASITEVPGNKKYPMAPASDTAISIAIFILPVLKQVSALGKLPKLPSQIILVHASARKYMLVFDVIRTAARGESAILAMTRTSGALV